MLLDISEMTRSGEKLKCVKRIIIHEAINPYFDEIEERNYINNLKYQDEKYYSTHYIIGKNNKCIRCIPDDEVSYSTNNLIIDYTSISVSCCFFDKNGKIDEEVINSLKKLIIYLSNKYGIKSYNINLHSDITGTRCPRYLCDNRYILNEITKNIWRFF